MYVDFCVVYSQCVTSFYTCISFRLKAINGSHAIALAAKHYSVPVSK
jgi:hypothetical protein